jgi:flagellar basal body P-ring formation protein FlgA
MNRHWQILVVPFALVLAAASAAAAGQALPALRANVIVNADVVRIGDLVENAGVVADVAIFRAPDLGTRGAVATERVLEAIRPHQLIGIDTRGLSEVVVTRASRAITPKQIAARVAKALEGQYGLGAARNILVEFDRGVRTLQVEPGVTGELQVVGLAYNPRSTRVDIAFDLPGSAALRAQRTRFTGIAIETIDAVAVDHIVERGQVLKSSDLIVQRRPKSEGLAITDIGGAVGLAARHQLRPGQPLHEADLMKPVIVQRGDPVTIVYEAPGLMLTLRGQAQEPGAVGDTISLLNAQSKRVVQGVVTAPGRVSVAAPRARFVANTPQPAAGAPVGSSRHEGYSVE